MISHSARVAEINWAADGLDWLADRYGHSAEGGGR